MLALGLAKDYLVFSDADVLWLTFRVLACGTIVVIGRAFVGERWKHKSVEVGYTLASWRSQLITHAVAGGRLCIISFVSPDIVTFCCFSSYAHCPVSHPHEFRMSINLYYQRRHPHSFLLVLDEVFTEYIQRMAFTTSLLQTLTLPFFQKQSAIVVLCGILLSLVTDAGFHTHNIGTLIPAYVAVGLEALSSSVSGHTRGVLLPSLGSSMTDGITVVIAFIMTSILYLCSSLVVRSSSCTFVLY